MKANEFIIVEAKINRRDKESVKTRNPVAKNLNITTSGAGQHKDRKAAEKRGEFKHKGKELGESIPAGYSYEPYEDDDDDVSKIYHIVTTPEGKRIRADFSPYEELSDKDIALWIELGMPNRQDLGQGGAIQKNQLYQMSKKVDEVDMSSPEFQQLLKSVGEKAKQGPKKTVYDPRTGKYKVVPVNTQGNKNG